MSTTTVPEEAGGRASRQLPRVGHFIGGDVTLAQVSEFTDIYDPAQGCAVRQVATATTDEVNAAVSAAASAFRSWSQVPPVRRAALMFSFRAVLLENLDRLAAIITAEHGKTLDDARAEVQRGIEVVEFACGIAHHLKGETSEQVARGVDSYSVRQPLGVCVGITPLNFPAMIPLWMFPIAIACGNTFVLKPSEKDPSLAIELALLFKKSGLPDGVLNVLNGGQTVVEALLDHPDVKAVSFVGSTPVAQSIYARAARAGKRVQALGGAKNHLVVMPDADLEQTADALIGAAFGSAGERCMAISVAVVVGDETADALITRLCGKVSELRIGPGAVADTQMGPLITREHRERVMSYIELGESEGARLVLDGRHHPTVTDAHGFFLGATIFDAVTPQMLIYRDEIFGPVLCVVRVNSLEEALQLANSHDLANGAAIFTRDGHSAQVFCSRVDAGMVGVNVPIPVPMAFHTFGGSKASAFGGHNMHGSSGVAFYTRIKTMTVRWKPAIGETNFTLPVTPQQL